MTNYLVFCKACNTRNEITIDDGTPLKTTDCDNHKCESCGKTGMNYPQMFD